MREWNKGAMNDKTSIKIICVLIYSCAVLIVPPIPNLYTFTINCLAYTVTIAVSSFVIYFLNTRSASNKNIINRILVLLIATLILKSTRDFLVSAVACFWKHQLVEIIESNPGIIFLIDSRYYKILYVCLASGLSSGRLLLFTNPVIFHRLQPTIGAMVVGFVTLCVGSLDLIYTWTVCGDDLKRSTMFIHFSVETGIDKIRIGNLSQTLSKEDESHEICYELPVIQLVILSAIFMEIARFIYSVVQEYKKKKKAGKISPSLQNGGHLVSLQKVQDLDVEAERIKDTQSIKTDSSLMTATPRKLMSQDCLSDREDPDNHTNSSLVVSDRNLTRNQGSTLLIRVQVHDAPNIRRVQVDDAPTIRRVQVHDDPTIRRDQVHDAPTIRRVQVHDDPTIRRDQVNDAPIIKRDQVHDDPTIRRDQVNDDPTIRRDQVHDDPTIRRDQVHDDPTIRRDQVNDDPTIRRVQVHEDPTIRRDQVHDAPTIRRVQVHEDPTIRRDKVHGNPTIRRDQVQDAPSFRRDQVHDAPTIRRVQVHDAPTIRRVQVHEDPTIRRDQVHDDPTIRSDQVHDAPTIRSDQVHDVPTISTEDGIIERDDVLNLSMLQSTANPTLNRKNIETASREDKNPESSNSSHNKMTDLTKVMRNNFKQHCLKTSSFITINFVIGFIYAICLYIFPSFTNISLMMFLNRLSTFVTIILVVLFDKDIIECFEQKILVHFSP